MDFADFGRAKEPWLRTFLRLPKGIPSQDTFDGKTLRRSHDRRRGKSAIHLVSAARPATSPR